MTCVQASRHAPSPVEPHDWLAWATRMQRTHKPVRCSGCGLYLVWVQHDARPGENEPPPVKAGKHRPAVRRT